MLLGSRQIQSMEAGIVKEVALNPPDFVVLLLPLCFGIDAHLHLRQSKRRFRLARGRAAFTACRSRSGTDEPFFVLAPALAVKHLLAVEGDGKVIRAFH